MKLNNIDARQPVKVERLRRPRLRFRRRLSTAATGISAVGKVAASASKISFAVVVAIALFGLVLTTSQQAMAQIAPVDAEATQAEEPITSKTLAAIESAASDDKYLFIFFWKTDNAQTERMQGVFQSAMDKWSESTDSIVANITDSDEKAAVDRFGVSRAPMPLVIALAPNGAITKGLPYRFDEEGLQECFVSPGTAKCMKAVQDSKLILLCVQNEESEFSESALQSVEDFKADERFATATEVIALDPADEAEASFLQDLGVDPETPQAVTLLLAPTGQLVASFVGAVTKDQIVAEVQAGPCADGECGPGGCCP